MMVSMELLRSCAKLRSLVMTSGAIFVELASDDMVIARKSIFDKLKPVRFTPWGDWNPRGPQVLFGGVNFSGCRV